MKLSLNWLKQYVTVRWSPREIAERLTLAGLEITDQRVVGDDVLLECEVTPNRPDWLSHVGVARELAALAGTTLRRSETTAPRAIPGRRPTITIQDRKACRRYVGTLIDGVTVGPSPAWLRARVEAVGLRSINNVVDVTNVVLFELGQPLHAFDADRLAKGRIVVRRAKPEERITTIDGTARTLDPSILVIADAERPVAIAGIMGGQATEVSVGTRRLLLESAWFDPLVTRRAARTLRLASDSSYRFERGVDLEQVAAAARRAAALIIEVAGGAIVGGPVDRRTARATLRPIPWAPAQAAALGTTIPATRQRQLFERLGCRVLGSGDRWRVVPPSFRRDLTQPVDLLEELARLTGYDRLPVTLPRPAPPMTARAAPPAVDLRQREQQLRRWLVASGLDEILTYSLVSPEALQRLGGSREAPITLRNPLSRDHSVLRPTLLIGALETVARNLNRRAPGVALFELGHTYHWVNGQPEERRTLAITLAGLRPSSWDTKPTPWTLFHAKGILEVLAGRMGLPQGACLEEAASAAEIVSPALTTVFEIPAEVRVIFGEVAWEPSWGQPTPPAMFQSLTKVPPVTRDLAIVVEEMVSHREIASAIRAAGGPLVQAVTLFDCYRGSQIPAGKKSLAYTVVYGAGDRTLTDAEVTAAHSAIATALQTQLRAAIR